MRALIVVGPSRHPPGTHEVMAGGRVIRYCLGQFGLAADLVTDWPRPIPTDVTGVVFIGDLFPAAVMPDRERMMADLGRLADNGCGMVCLHYATGLEAKHVGNDGDHPLLRWIGGYFATRCRHHQSVARVFPNARVEPADTNHPVGRGWSAFELHDEPYIHNYFGPDGPADGFTTLATAMLPPERPRREIVAWAIRRADGGRGAGIVMPHFYRNWGVDDLRTLILNAIVWTAGREVPGSGVRVRLPDLATFGPAAVEPPGRNKSP